MTILYTVLVIWVAFGLLLYLAIMGAFKCDIETLLAILKDEGKVLEVMELSKQYDEIPIINKVVFSLFFLFMSPFLFVFFIFKSKGSN